MSEMLTVPPAWQRAPATLALLGLSILGFLLVYLPFPFSWVSYLTFTPFEIRGEMIRFGEMGGQYWRLLTPAFLHFGWLHIVFNGLWLWELGHRVELLLGSRMLLALFLPMAPSISSAAPRSSAACQGWSTGCSASAGLPVACGRPGPWSRRARSCY